MFELTDAETIALFLSLKVAAVGMLASLPFGIAFGLLLARYDFPGKLILDGLLHLPLVIPPVATGYILLMFFGVQGPAGSLLNEWLGVRLVFTWQGAALVAALMGFPLMVRSIRLSAEAIDPGLVGAARTLGAAPIRIFITITFPLLLPGVIAGALLSFSRALGEFGATIAFVGNIPGETQTLPLALYSALQQPGGEEMGYRLVALSVLLAIVTLGSAELLARQVRKQISGEVT